MPPKDLSNGWRARRPAFWVFIALGLLAASAFALFFSAEDTQSPANVPATTPPSVQQPDQSPSPNQDPSR